MATDFHLRVQQVLEAALRLPPEQRADFITRACGPDAALLREVQSLLPHYEQTHDYEPPRGPEWFLPGTTTIVRAGAEAAAELAAEDPAPPFFIDRYRCERVLGRGGMGVVYLAQQTALQRLFAVKLLRQGLLSPENRWRFAFEAQLVSRLQHPGIARVFEAGEVRTARGTRPYLVLEYIRGQPLVPFAESRALNVLERLALLIRVCEAAEYAHRRGVIHRDLKPGNILVDEGGQPHILDFGLARLAQFELVADDELGGAFVGTPAYASPEQQAGKNAELTPASDVYALGVIAHELLTGRLPHATGQGRRLELARVGLENCPRAVAARQNDFRRGLRAILSAALAESPADRYASAGKLGAALAALVREFGRTSRWSALRARLARLLSCQPPPAPDGTSRPLSAVLRARLTMSMQGQAHQVPGEGRPRGE